MEEIFMITFTNDATNQMSMRLQDMLMLRCRLTGQKKYLIWMEAQSQMNIRTIDGFAYKLLGEYGIDQGFTKDVSFC